eukprot:maker-scaffold_5-snap-gene-12.55-mRNA-1 protein AED:0.00 eAED:0.00 QI:107/1/1/1/1/1/3/167/691
MSASDWVKKVDPVSGRDYYYNKILKQTAWNLPSTDPAQKALEDAAWVEHFDPVSNEPFYYNTITKIRTNVNPLANNPQQFGRGIDSYQPNPRGEYEREPEPDTRNRRHLSIKLGKLGDNEDEILEGVKNQAPAEEKFGKLRALRRNNNLRVSNSSLANNGSLGINIDQLISLNQNDPEQIHQVSLPEYAANHFNFKTPLFGSKVTMEALLSYQNSPIKRALHKDVKIDKKATKSFKIILAVQGDITGSEKSIHDIRELMKIAIIEAPQELRDEIFCQVIKQVTAIAPDSQSCVNAWQLLSLCCGAFPPGGEFEGVLKSFLDESLQALPHGESRQFCEYAKLRLQKTLEVGPRSQIPSSLEIAAALKRNPVKISVFLINQTKIDLEVDTWTTIIDVRNQMGEFLGVKDVTIFALLEISEDGTEFVLPLRDRVLDILSDWEVEYYAYKKRGNAPKNKFQFSLRLFTEIDPSDQTAIELAYYQAVTDVTESRYPLQDSDVVHLVALQTQEQFSDQQGTNDPLGNQLKDYLPEAFVPQAEIMRPKILREYGAIRGLDSFKCMKNYLDYVQQWPSYGVQVFPVSPLNNPEYPVNVFLAVNAKAVFVIHPATKEFLSTFEWDTIVTWGYSDGFGAEGGKYHEARKKNKKKLLDTNFCLVCGNFLQQTKLYFKTPQALDIFRLVEAYGNRIKGYKNPE